MSSILKITEASSLALHSSVIFAREKDRMVSAKEISKELNVSCDHLSKVLQRLGKMGIVKSLRGPDGGFKLTRNPADIKLMEIYEAIEGRFNYQNCLLGKSVCKSNKCVLGELSKRINKDVFDYFMNTTVADLL